MTEKFCILEKNKKTFNILKRYIEDIQKGIDLLNEDNHIQAEEITEHIYNTGQSGVDWIEKHSRGERIYLNSIKELAILFLCFERDLTWDHFCYFCDKINIVKEKLLDKIY